MESIKLIGRPQSAFSQWFFFEYSDFVFNHFITENIFKKWILFQSMRIIYLNWEGTIAQNSLFVRFCISVWVCTASQDQIA